MTELTASIKNSVHQFCNWLTIVLFLRSAVTGQDV